MGLVDRISLMVLTSLLCAGAVGQEFPTGVAGSTSAVVEIEVSLTGFGYGHVASQPAGINCPDSSCGMSVPAGTEVTLTAEPAEYWYSFMGWGGDVDCPGLGPCIFVAEDHVWVEAVFAYSAEVVVGLFGEGEGRVFSEPAGIDCPDEECWMLVQPGTEVTLTAEPAEYWYSFMGWGGDVDCPGLGPCTFVAEDHIWVEAIFENSVPIAVELSGEGDGVVISQPQGIDCPASSCGMLAAPGSEITLTAVPSSSLVHFAGWQGVAECDAAPVCTIVLDDKVTATAVFEPAPDPVFKDAFMQEPAE